MTPGNCHVCWKMLTTRTNVTNVVVIYNLQRDPGQAVFAQSSSLQVRDNETE